MGNEDILKGQWEQLKGKVRAEWGKLTDDDLDWIAGRREELVGKLRERYGWEHAEAREKLDAFLTQHGQSSSPD